MELYKYTGSVAVLTVRFGKAETVTLYDSYDDSVAPVRLDVRGALAEYIKKIEGTDSEERALLWFKMYRSYRLFDELGCGGQFFTTGVKLFRRRGRWYAYHFVSLDM